MSRGKSLFGGTSLGPSPRVLKELGPTRGLPPANWGEYTYTCHACWWQVWHFSQKTGGQVCQGQLSLPFFRGRYMSRGGGTLGLPRGNSQALPRALKLGSYRSGPGGLLWWNSGNSRNCRPQSSVSPRGDIQRLQSSFTIV